MSVIADFFGVNGLNPVKVGGTGTSAKYFPRLLGASIGAVPATPSSSSAVGALWVPGDSKLNAQQFDVEATGTFGSDTGDPSGTVAIKLYAVTGSLLVPVYTALASTTAFVPLVGAVGSWAIKASLFGDSASGIVGGSYAAYINGALNNSTPKNTDAILSSINFGSGNTNLYQGAPFGLVVGVTFGTSDATNTASMYQFQIIGS